MPTTIQPGIIQPGIIEALKYIRIPKKDTSSLCPTLKVDPLRQELTVDDFIDQVKAIKQIYDDGLIEKPESMYSAFSKLSAGKAVKSAAKYWNDKIKLRFFIFPKIS